MSDVDPALLAEEVRRAFADANEVASEVGDLLSALKVAALAAPAPAPGTRLCAACPARCELVCATQGFGLVCVECLTWTAPPPPHVTVCSGGGGTSGVRWRGRSQHG